MKSQPGRVSRSAAEAILRAAEETARRDGPRFSMEAVARAAGISRATLFRAVGSRRDLVELLARRGLPLASTSARDRILLASAEVFGEAGFSAATMEEIAARAGVSPMTVYRRFRTKEGLLRAVIARGSPRRIAHGLKARGGIDLRADLERFAEAALRAGAASAGLIHMALTAPPAEQELFRKLRDEPRGSVAALESWFRRLAGKGELRKDDPRRLAVAFAGLLVIFSYFAPRFQGVPLTDPAATARFIVRLLLDGAGAGRGGKGGAGRREAGR